ncbi:outer membrane lipoprotein chaperone LolA [Ramlibacter alkalitolerans]|jgi:outer membrane lipoprotein carrier protein|uniref:Outer-membrane lipoprotein carrier protein n=1 Tax=Ramlibacter alkalitolerans TaxID=2039631 RepID=A0ABS1JX41_9BURK|nr:outer membrane lipoprotein chaperone LolA [Ramlibacter alkalitolerans]MBL0428666.1 outer membrane lipoprotein chaperone LolA [Ramlibacter alkalitolerans]
MKKLFAAFALTALAAAAHAGAIESLENFIRTAKSGHADFTQVITAPPKNGEASRTKTSTGTFDFQRPNRFRFEYRKPFEQTIVADGQTLWLHDKDLNQVTQRKQAKVLGSTPAALIAASPDLETLKKDFDLQALPDRDGMQWVQATPRVKEGQLANMKVGFRGDQLAALDILDSFGQRSLITFSGMQVNAGVSADAFRFQPPKGADVVQSP